VYFSLSTSSCTVCLSNAGISFHHAACVHMALQVTQLGHVKDLATAFHKILSNPKAKNQIYNVSGERFVTFDGIAKACAKAAGAPEPELIHYNPKDFDFGGKKAFPLRDQHFFASIDKVVDLSRIQMPSHSCHLTCLPLFTCLLSFATWNQMHSITSHWSESGVQLFVYVVSEHLQPILSVAQCVCVMLQAMADLEWAPEYDLVKGLTDSYEKDFGRGTFRKEADFATDDMVLEKVKSKEPALA